MTTETPVVLSLDERRNTFVRDRFGQKDVFDHDDFEDFVDELATATNLRDLDAAIQKKLLRLINHGKQPTDLRNYATPFTLTDLNLTPYDWIERSAYMRNAAQKTFERLMPRDGTRAFWGCMNVLALLDTPDARDIDHYGTLRAHPLSETLPDSPHEVLLNIGMGTPDIIEVIFAEWYRGWPKAEVARDHCIACLRERIRAEREKAEHDFNTAVAVSADGRKIVHADEVHIGRYAIAHFGGPLWEHFKTVSATECHEHKILRNEGDLPRYKDNWEATCRGDTHIKQGLILNDHGKRSFLTTKEFCPPELLA